MSKPLARISLDDILKLDYQGIAGEIYEFIRDSVRSSGTRGAVVGVSGGVDSSTVLMLLVNALGRERVYALIMPDPSVTPESDVEDARSLVESVGVKWNIINIAPIVDVYRSSIPIYESEDSDRLPLGNLRARIRMTLLYYYANKYNLLVAGTGDRSEILIGYFTKYGDGAVDILPIGTLYKTQVRRLAKALGVPDRIAFKPSSPRLWAGHEAEKELGITYEEIDLILYSLFDLKVRPEEVPKLTGIEADKVKKVIEMHERSRHKREMPRTLPLEVVSRYKISE